MTTNNWENYGDMNPIKYGGFFIQEDQNGNYHTIELINLDGACGEEGFMISEAYVDINDEWIDWGRVLNYTGDDENTDPMQKVYGAFNYYGCEEFGGHSSTFSTEEETIEELKSYGIEVKKKVNKGIDF